MSALATPLAEKLDKKLEKIGVKDIWRLRYKRGPILREVFFKFLSTGNDKEDKSRAYILGQRWCKHLAKEDNSKVVLVGTPEPFAIDIEEVMREENG